MSLQPAQKKRREQSECYQGKRNICDSISSGMESFAKVADEMQGAGRRCYGDNAGTLARPARGEDERNPKWQKKTAQIDHVMLIERPDGEEAFKKDSRNEKQKSACHHIVCSAE